MLKLIEKNITYSNKIINDLLDYSKEIKLDLVESNPSALLSETLSIMEIPKKVKILNFTKDTPTFQVDIDKMKRAIVNIISNSFDAMPKGGKLSFRSKQSNRTVKLIFSDTGVGISERKLMKIWAPFYTTKAKGMGFGLPICKRIVEAHGGSVKVKSTLRKGTTVELAIPLNEKPIGGEKIWINPLDSSLLMTTKT
jgi:signal transduction histidine kinase